MDGVDASADDGSDLPDAGTKVLSPDRRVVIRSRERVPVGSRPVDIAKRGQRR